MSFAYSLSVLEKKINPMNVSQWEFYVLPTSVIDAKLGAQKSVGLERIKRLGAIEASYGGIGTAIASCCGSGQVRLTKDSV